MTSVVQKQLFSLSLIFFRLIELSACLGAPADCSLPLTEPAVPGEHAAPDDDTAEGEV